MSSASHSLGTTTLSLISRARRYPLAIPSSVILAAQPYSTLRGYGLSLDFCPKASPLLIPLSSEEDLEFSYSHRLLHSLPFCNPMSVSMYQHLALEALAEFCCNEIQHSGGANSSAVNKSAPMPDFWDKVGEISTTYATTGNCQMPASCSRNSVSSTNERCIGVQDRHQNMFPRPKLQHLPPIQHPVSGGVELLGSSVRGGLLDVRLSLYDTYGNPVFSALMTGPKGKTDELSSNENYVQKSNLKRPEMGTLVEYCGASSNKEIGYIGERDGVLIGPVVVHNSNSNKICDYDMKECISLFRVASHTPLHHEPHNSRLIAQMAVVPSSISSISTSEGEERKEPLDKHPIPPWLLHSIIHEFAQEKVIGPLLRDKGCDTLLSETSSIAVDFLKYAAQSRRMGSSEEHSNSSNISEILLPLHLTAHNTTLHSDIYMDEPFMLVCRGPITIFHQYHVPPWQHRIGLPPLRGEPCIPMQIEIWQDNEAILTGIFFFTF